jgi:tetratricopeptide (TPR) repeat protein
VLVGNTVLGKDAFEAFERMIRIYPAPLPQIFPAQRQPVTFMAEVEAIYRHTLARGISVSVDSLDWVWKKRYFTAAPFFDLLSVNLGFTDTELQRHYNRSPEEFRINVITAEGEDSSFVPPFENAKRQVADALFYKKYPPDSAFIAKLGEEDLDSASLREHWLYNVRSNTADFFMRQFFFERTGEVYADSVQQIYGAGKPIQSDDIDIIRAWAGEGRRNMRIKELVEWLYKWKTFAEHVEKNGLTSTPSHKDMIHWASRVEHANAYLRDGVVPSLSTGAAEIDADLAELIIFDQARRTERPATARVQAELNNINRVRSVALIDSVVYGIRKAVGVIFLQDELKDEKSSDPAALMATADSLKDAAAEMPPSDAEEILEETEKLLRTVAMDFAFAPEGHKAMNELAKMYLDRYNAAAGFRQDGLLAAAINFYRRAQILDKDLDNLCNSYFMVGFTYDEHIKNYALAEANYKWILRNAPNCALASDAEFMIQNLGEPMTSIEEIKGQSLRQGRKIDFGDDAGDDVAIAE